MLPTAQRNIYGQGTFYPTIDLKEDKKTYK